MKTIPISELREHAKIFPAGFFDAVVALGNVAEEILTVSDESALTAIASEYRPLNKPWPIWARTLRAQAIPEEKGVGDTLARILGPIGGDAFKKRFKQMFGRPCRCAERQIGLNEQFPYARTP